MTETTIHLDEILEKVSSYDSNANIALIKKAFSFTHDVHCEQKRLEGTPYVGHPLAVASILADMQMDSKTIVAGLLHDTVEDTETTIEDIRALFGNDVAFMVNALTKLKRMEFKTSEEAQAENFRKMFLAMAEDVRVILIKFADRLHNMKTLMYMPPHKQKSIAAETLDIYAPLANRLGIGWLKSEFENLGFKYLHPELYEEISRKVAEKRQDKELFIKELATTLETKLQEQGISGRVTGRIKTAYGIYQKMQHQRITFEEINDVFGLRIITQTNEHCYMILGLIHSLWIPVPGRFKDYIAIPKSNLYQSLHTTVMGSMGERVEFQIRTEEMHLIAEKGIAAHWMYKEKGKPVHDKDARYFNWLRDLVYMQKDSDAKEFLDMFKGEVFPDVVYVFTPAGQIKELPAGSTPVDFAYAIHTEVGNRCAGAKINGRIVPLRYHLKNGDTVEIINSQSHNPSKDWLGFVVTHKARNKIRHWVKAEQSKQGIELGMAIIEEEFRKNNIKVSVVKSKRMLEIAQSLNYKSIDELLIAIGFGKQSLKQIINLLKPEKKPEDVAEHTKIKKPVKHGKGIHITGIDNLLYSIARCCYPVPGDTVAGFITRGKGVTIHRVDCQNFKRTATEEERIINLSWNSNGENISTARVNVETVDKPGMLASLSALISTFNINLSHLEARSLQNKHAHFAFTLEVKDKTQLTNLTNKIMSTDGVIRVSR
ncbi:MAG: bifunctional (p)ppGpp synthetase/guanosine-3',5'-bis(diphosphate) 3'-pyrophosphohydrolase [Nitrospirae bacterium]|nr:bifunctional (p)ppGpp synthetase/guanosine-3',5'-bis(diphosphate) 3'-pyrophosphohydrolase [Nitrospirota bacterium]